MQSFFEFNIPGLAVLLVLKIGKPAQYVIFRYALRRVFCGFSYCKDDILPMDG